MCFLSLRALWCPWFAVAVACSLPITSWQCHQVLASLSVWGNNVRHWLHYGCYKAESYGAMEIIRPCPSHIICSQMADFKKKAFCDKVKQDELVPGK